MSVQGVVCSIWCSQSARQVFLKSCFEATSNRKQYDISSSIIPNCYGRISITPFCLFSILSRGWRSLLCLAAWSDRKDLCWNLSQKLSALNLLILLHAMADRWNRMMFSKLSQSNDQLSFHWRFHRYVSRHWMKLKTQRMSCLAFYIIFLSCLYISLSAIRYRSSANRGAFISLPPTHHHHHMNPTIKVFKIFYSCRHHKNLGTSWSV